jgi:transposase
MEITREQFARVEGLLPVQRGNVRIDNYTFVNAVLWVVRTGCPWRDLPGEFGNWYSVYQRFSRWARSGVVERLFTALQAEGVVAVRVEVLALDSTSVKVHPHGHGALKKGGASPSGSPGEGGTPKFMWYPSTTALSRRSTCPPGTPTTPPRGVSR